MISKNLATGDARIAQRATIAGGLLYLSIGLLPVFMGLLAPNLLATPLADSEQVIPALAEQFLIFPQFVLPHLVYILLMGAIISAILSTVDSVLLSGASILSNNFLVRALHLGRRRAAEVYSNQRCCPGVVAYCCAIFADRIKRLVEIAASFGSAGLVPVVIFGLFSKLGGEKSATLALMCGLLGWVVGVIFQLTAPLLHLLCARLSTAVYLITALLMNERRQSALEEKALTSLYG